MPLAELEPAAVSLVWRADNRNPLLQSLLAAAKQLPQSVDGV
jgi:hypothetical protein